MPIYHFTFSLTLFPLKSDIYFFIIIDKILYLYHTIQVN